LVLSQNMVTLMFYGSLVTCSCTPRLYSDDLVLSTFVVRLPGVGSLSTPGSTHMLWFSSRVWLNSLVVVLSLFVVALKFSGSLELRGYSQVLVPSLVSVVLKIIGSLQCHGCTPIYWFSPIEWLYSARLVLSAGRVVLRSFGSLTGDGYSGCLILSWLVVLSQNVVALGPLGSFVKHGCTRKAWFSHLIWLLDDNGSLVRNGCTPDGWFSQRSWLYSLYMVLS